MPVSGLSGVAINAAMSQLGVPYVYATSNPGVSFDCSGLTHYAWGQAGVYLPRNSRAQAAATPHVPIADAQPGDLLFYYSPISHVGIYLGGGQLVHAPDTGDVREGRQRQLEQGHRRQPSGLSTARTVPPATGYGRSVHGIDIDRVSRWLTDHVAGAAAPFEFTLITGGRSNLTFLVTGADGRRARPAPATARARAGHRARHGA